MNNLCRTISIIGANEVIKLITFLENRYFLIDTFPHNHAVTNEFIANTIINIEWFDAILDDIIYINPNQIVLTTIRSNGALLPALLARATNRGTTILDRLVQNLIGNNQNVFHSPSNRAFTTFNPQIQHAITQGALVL